MRRVPFPTLLVLVGLSLAAAPAHAYIGPGAGFAFASSFFILILTIGLAFAVLLTWPLRWVFRALRGRKALAKARARRVVILGLDGQDPALTEQFMAEGLLPNFERLAGAGGFRRLRTSLLSESPVAWSSFTTGANPGKHRVFDFLVPNRKSHLPELSSARISPPRRTLPLGRYRIPLGRPRIAVGRKSKPFWRVLGEHGVFSTILRVPITFPPEKFHGVLLSAMCAPDLKGSQGTYFYYTDEPEGERKLSSGQRIEVERRGEVVRSHVSGPENTMVAGAPEMRLPLEVRPPGNGRTDYELRIDGKSYPLPLGRFTPWIRLEFKAAPGVKVRGIARLRLMEFAPTFRLYMTPINIDPEKPALPIAHPQTYAIYLAKTQGPYATLGVAEDMSALNEQVLDEDGFLENAWDIHAERERQFFDALDKTRRGLVTCVFDITDRLQHMFFRFIDPRHPAGQKDPALREKYGSQIRELYIEMDRLVGRTMERLGEDEVLLVMSDHGFKSFRRGVNLNTLLWREGLLALKSEAPTGADMLQDIDWSQTRAYAVGFGGIYLNLKGREARGIVEPGEQAEAVKAKIRAALENLADPEDPEATPVARVYDQREAFSGPYAKEGPDMIAGFTPGYRVGWASVTGGVTPGVFEDNTRPWGGDHNFNPEDVPGMLFSNRPIAADNPHIMDLGPTVLDLFGVAVPGWCDGRPVMGEPEAAEEPAGEPAGEPETAGAGK